MPWRSARWLSWPTVIAGSAAVAEGAEPKQPPERKERTLFVPFEDLSLILDGPNERVFMTQAEYRTLEAEAAKKPPTKAPQAAVVLNAAYDAQIQENLATLSGQLEIEVLDPGLHIVPLVFQGVSLRSATLDDATAPIGADPKGQYCCSYVAKVGINSKSNSRPR